jgi:chromosome segregation ATPase
VLKLDLLSFLSDSSALFFPRLHSSDETGAVRGTCVLASDLVRDIAACSLLRGGDWKDWKMMELQTVLQEKITEWSSKIDRLLQQGDEQAKLGLLEEERGKTLEIQRELQTCLQEKIDEWNIKVDRLLQQGDEKTRLGRLLVEERAKTLDLQRQIYRLEHSLERSQQELRDPLEQAEQTIGKLERSQQELRDLLEQAEQTIGRLARSRTLRRLSFITSRPLRYLGQAQHLLEQMKLALQRG